MAEFVRQSGCLGRRQPTAPRIVAYGGRAPPLEVALAASSCDGPALTAGGGKNYRHTAAGKPAGRTAATAAMGLGKSAAIAADVATCIGETTTSHLLERVTFAMATTIDAAPEIDSLVPNRIN